MNRMLIVIFNAAAEAAEGARMLKVLDAQTTISIFSMRIIYKDAEGGVQITRSNGVGPEGTGIGFAVGALIGLIGGPAGVALGAVAGSLVGAVRDYWVAGVGLDFVEEAQKVLDPGKYAVVAEIEEDWTAPLDEKMNAGGGTVFRRERADVSDVHFDQDIAAFKAEAARLAAEALRVEGDARSKLHAKIGSVKNCLESSVQRALERDASLEQEMNAKIAVIERQRATAVGDGRTALDRRAEEVRGAHRSRSAKLRTAWKLAVEAVTP